MIRFSCTTSRPAVIWTNSFEASEAIYLAAAGAEPLLAFGVMGGAIQPQGHVQVLLNLLGFGMDLQEAIDSPRFRHFDGFWVGLEVPVPELMRVGLAKLGHQIVVVPPAEAGGAQAVMKLAQWVGRRGVIRGRMEARRGGSPTAVNQTEEGNTHDDSQ